jgi:hypothetical protein
MNDLFLLFKFTDRGGNGVYTKYAASDAKRQVEPLGEIRLPPDELKDVLCYRNHETIICNCSKCRVSGVEGAGTG